MPSTKRKDEVPSEHEPGTVLLELHEEICGSINDLVVFIDRTGTVIDVNPRVDDLVGYAPNEVIGRNVLKLDVLSPKEIPRIAKLITDSVMKGKESPLVTLELIHKNGTSIPVEASNHLVRKGGSIIGAVGILRDITEHKKVEDALRESEERFRQFFENEPEYCYMVSPEGLILDVNKAARTILGYKKSELVDKPIQTIYAPESLPRMRQLFAKWKKSGTLRDEEMTIITKKGDKRVIVLSVDVVRNKDGGVLHSISVQCDITGRKRAEEELASHRDRLQQLVDERVAELQAKTEELEREVIERKRVEEELRSSEARLRVLFENAPDAIYLHDLKGTFIDGNKAAEKMIGYKKEEMIGKSFLNAGLISRDTIKDALKVLKDLAFTRNATDALPVTLTRKDGSTVEVEVRGFPFKSGGRTICMGIARDTSARKEAERALRESEENFRKLAENANDGIVILTGKKACCVYGNLRAAQLLGYTLEEMTALELGDVVVSEELPIVAERYQKRLAGKESPPQYEITLKKKDGTRIPFELAAAKTTWQGEPADLIILRDLTERKRAEALTIIQRDLGRSLSAISAIEDAAVLCLDAAMRASKMDAGGLYLVDRKTGGLYLVYSTGLGRAFVAKARRFKADTPQTKLIKERRPVHTAYGKLDMPVGDTRMREGLRALSILPILHEGEVIACLNMASHMMNAVSPPARTALEAIATQMGDVIARLEAERELLQERDRAQRYLDIAGVIIVALDVNGAIRLINRKGCEILGHPREELIGKDWFSTVIPDRMRDATSVVFQRLMEGKSEGIESYENPIVTRKGDERIIRWHNTLLQDNNGVIIGTLSSGEDITERKREEERMKRQLMRYTLEEGRLYLVQEEAPVLCIEAFGDALRAGYRGIAVSRTPEAEFRKTVPGEYTFHWLVEQPGEHGMAPRSENIERMVETLPQHSVVLVDRLDYLVLKNGFDETLALLERLRELAYLGGHIAITSLDPSTIGHRELRLLEKEALEISTRLRTTLPEDLLELVRFVYKQNRLGLKPSNTELGNGLGISQPTVRKRVNQLVMAGHLVQREKGRNKVVELSERGWQLLEGGTP